MKPAAKQGELNGFLDHGSHLRGELTFDTHFRVHGKFTGEVITEGELIVGEGGEVEGEMRVGQVVVSGIVRGSIQASRRVQITATGKVFADVAAPERPVAVRRDDPSGARPRDALDPCPDLVGALEIHRGEHTARVLQ